jgi:predicted NAD-dependent protein-ADP-ribosyltransferase YbiA (DUF1768 family)
MNKYESVDTTALAIKHLIDMGYIIEQSNVSSPLDKAMEAHYIKILEVKGYKVKADKYAQIQAQLDINADYDAIQWINCGVSGEELKSFAAKARLYLQKKWGSGRYSVMVDPKNKRFSAVRLK